MWRCVLGGLCCLVVGCATTSRGPRREKMLGYTDHKLFVIEHHDPAHGGRIVGSVCAVDLQLDARQKRNGVVLYGGVADQHEMQEGTAPGRGYLPFYVEARERPAQSERDLVGGVLDGYGITGGVTLSHAINLRLTRDRVRGQVGERTFDLRVRGDDYVGTMQIADTRMPFALRGAAQLWAMPAAAQAAILPLLMSCDGPKKVIQVVDLRQSVTPPPAPPRWWSPAASGTRVPRLPAFDRLPGAPSGPMPAGPPREPPRAPQLARVRA